MRVLLALAGAAGAAALNNGLGLTPQMGCVFSRGHDVHIQALRMLRKILRPAATLRVVFACGI